MKKIFSNRYFLTIVVVAIGAYAFYYLSKSRRKGTTTNYFDDLAMQGNDGSMVDQAFCDSPAMQGLGGNYVIGCYYAIGNCSKVDLVNEFEIFANAQATGSSYQCSSCCASNTRISNISDERFAINNNVS